jgi:hypothetical protein
MKGLNVNESFTSVLYVAMLLSSAIVVFITEDNSNMAIAIARFRRGK